MTVVAGAPARAMADLRDTFGRVATDLRISLTDRCNLRCVYCMPAEGSAWLPRREILSDTEVVRLAGVAVRKLGVTSIRFTGGEPLLRPGLVGLVADVAALDPRPEIALTTNGIGLAGRAAALTAAGLNRINVSLDTLRPDRFRTLARRDRLADVLAGIDAAQSAGLRPVKINTVLMRGVNDDEPAELLDFCRVRGLSLRFIEQMPLDGDHVWRRDRMVTASEILGQLTQHVALTPVSRKRDSAPAELWHVDGGPDTVGIVASVTRPFCRTCTRTRLTADGQVRNCLFSTTETDLRGLLRSGASDEEIAARWQLAMRGKAAGHGISGPEGFARASRPMNAIGG